MNCKSVLICGNGKSRLSKKKFLDNWKDEIWVCNFAFLEFFFNYRFNLLGTVHENVVPVAEAFRRLNNLNFEIITEKTFKEPLGYSSGWELVNEAVLRGYNKIYLIGYDSLSGSNADIHGDNIVIKNFLDQASVIIKKYNLKKKEIEKDIFLLLK